jgi:hypothetical protein
VCGASAGSDVAAKAGGLRGVGGSRQERRPGRATVLDVLGLVMLGV